MPPLVVIDVSAIPNGMLPFWLAVLVYLLSYYCVLLAVSLVTDSTGWHATAITIGNVSVNFLIPFLLVASLGRRAPRRRRRRSGPPTSWPSSAIELAAGAAALGLAIYVRLTPTAISCKEPSCPVTIVCTRSTRFARSRCSSASCSTPGSRSFPGMIPGIWAMTDNSPSTAISVLLFTSHIFRMSLFFFVAGFFARMLFQRSGARGFWANRAKRILVPLVAGWVVLFPAIAVVWIWGLTKTFGGTLPAPPRQPAAGAARRVSADAPVVPLLPAGALRRSCWSPRASSWRSIAQASIRRGDGRGRAAAPCAPAPRRSLLALPLVAALYVRAGLDHVVRHSDARSVAHSASWSSLVGYGTAVAFGWLIHRQADLLGVWAQQWPLHLAGAVIATGVVSVDGRRLTPIARAARTGPDEAGVRARVRLAIWCWSFAVIGLAMRFLSQRNDTVRYVADASYWIYLVHLPIVAAFQVLVGQLPWHWSIKFPLVLAASFAVLFASYRYLVRSTFIGQMLNGRRYPRSRRTGRSGPTKPRRQRSAARPEHRGLRQTGTADRSLLATLRGVHKRYGKTVALAGLDLEVRRGELLAVLGPNGAGKSTAISLWLGLLEPDAGTVRLFGGSPLDVESRRHVGVMMQEVGLTPELRVRELIELTASYYPDPLSAQQTLALTRIEALADRPYAKLSAGQKRQVQFALAICGRPPLLFLDEPTVGLDVEARETMWRTIRAMIAQGCSIVLTTHYLEEAEALADRVAVLASGRLIASGSVEEIRSVVSRKHISCSSGVAVERGARLAGRRRGHARDRTACTSPRSTPKASSGGCWPRMTGSAISKSARRAWPKHSPSYEGGCVMNAHDNDVHTAARRPGRRRADAARPDSSRLRERGEVRVAADAARAWLHDPVPAAAGAGLSVLRRASCRRRSSPRTRRRRTTCSPASRCSRSWGRRCSASDARWRSSAMPAS